MVCRGQSKLGLVKFDEKFMCWDAARLATVNVKDHVTLTLEREKVKDDKTDDGQVNSYWWAIAGVGERVDTMPEPNPGRIDRLLDDEPTPGQGIAARATEPDRPLIATPPTNLFPQPDGVIRGHVENIAVRLWIAEGGDEPFTTTDNALAAIRQLRDRVYHQLTNMPIAPEHWCYKHETPHHGNEAGVYGHKKENGLWCMEAQDAPAAPEATGEPTQDPPNY